MEEREQGGVEILVHTTAPSRGKDDARYRALASAYLEFEPAKSQHCSDDVEEGQSSSLNHGGPSQLHIGLTHSLSDEPRARPPNDTVLDEEDESYATLQSQVETTIRRSYLTRSFVRKAAIMDPPEVSFRSVDHNAGSFEFRDKGQPHSPVVNERNSWNNPPSVVPDSQPPYDRAIPENSSPTRILELYLQHLDRSKSPSPVAVDRADHSSRHEPEVTSIRCSQPNPAPNPNPIVSSPMERVFETPALERERESSMLHVSKKRRLTASKDVSPSKTRSESCTTRFHQIEERSTELPRSSPTSLPGSSAEKLPSPQRRQLLHFISSGQSACSKSSNIASRAPNPHRIIAPNEIHPPLPPTSRCAEISPLTPALQALTKSPDLTSKYAPLSKTRPLRNLERGFWSVSMATWGTNRKIRAWENLMAFVGGGKAGWGVWCSRNHSTRAEDGARGHEDSECGNVVIGHGGERDELRLYCWGEVVKHIYLLLYLVSERRARRSESKWIDGGGNTVIVMPVVPHASVCSATGC